jgi:hypothetical protein
LGGRSRVGEQGKEKEGENRRKEGKNVEGEKGKVGKRGLSKLIFDKMEEGEK